MIPSLIEAAVRSVLVAFAVWAGLQTFRVRNVLAQKAAWGLVLAAAVFMPMLLPLAARLPGFPARATLILPAHPLSLFAALLPARESVASPLTASPLPAPLTSSAPSTTAPVAATRVSPAPQATENISSLREERFTPVDRYPAPTISSSHIAAPTVLTPPSASPRKSLSLFEMAWLFYLAIAAALVARMLYGLTAAINLWQTAEPASIHPRSPLAEGLHLRSSRAVASPVTIGSAVILPADFTEWDSEKLRIVLAHERSHIRQGDFYLQILAGLYAALFWFSPLGWWLKRQLSDLAEAISDRAGIEQAASRSAYAQILLEFAAAPRPTLIGVAMARTGSLSRRIERLLNDSSFRQSFAGTRRRALLAVLLVPISLFAATTLIRVEAAGQAPVPPAAPTEALAPVAPDAPPEALAPVAPDAPPAPVLGVSKPVPVAPESPEMTPPLPSEPELAPVPPVGPVYAASAVVVAAPVSPVGLLAPPLPPAAYGVGYGYGAGQSGTTTQRGSSSYTNSSHGGDHSYRYSYSSNGDSYALIKGNSDHITFSGEWMEGRREELDKARKIAHGDFLWFTHGGKSYIVDNPAIVTQIDDMYKPMEALGKQQEELGRQQEELGKKQEELGRHQEEASIPTPDMSKEIAEIEAAMAKLKANQGKNMTQDQFGEIQEKLGALQGRMGEIQGEIGAKQGELGGKMGELGAQQGRLGAQQGRLGAEQGRIAQEADRKVKGIIDQSLSNGTAKQIQ
jgi:beta-lactamase regulating signal transducer with metallopeptidase domain